MKNYQKQFNLRLIEKSDLDFIRSIRQDSETVKNLGTIVFLNKEKQELWYDSVIKNTTQAYFIFEELKIDQGICMDTSELGYVRIDEIDRINKSMRVGGDIHPQLRGRGLSKEMYRLIFELGFGKWNMHRLWLLVMEENKRAIHIYNKLGFKEEGRQKQAILRNGKYQDYIMMSLFEGDYYGKREKDSK